MKISACMIARNEEKNIGKCLCSIMNFADEIIVVDTGSTDATISVAESMGAWVFERPWKKDFARARNYALSKCTGDWILWIDADEEFYCERTKDQLLESLASIPDHGVVRVALENKYVDGRPGAVVLADRLFRRAPGVRWKGAVHEHVTHNGKAAHATWIKIIHWGYDLPEEEMVAKAERNLEILLRQYRKQSILFNRVRPETYRYIIQSAITAQREDMALDYAEEYYGRQCKPNYPSDTIYSVVMLYANRKDLDNARRWLALGLELYPRNLDIGYCQYHLGRLTKDNLSMIVGGNRYVEAYRRISADCINIGAGIIIGYNPGRYKEVLANLTATHLAIGIAYNKELNDTMRQNPMPTDGIFISHVQNVASHLREEGL